MSVHRLHPSIQRYEAQTNSLSRNALIAARLSEAADVLSAQDATPFRALAHRRAAQAVRQLGRDLEHIERVSDRLEATCGAFLIFDLEFRAGRGADRAQALTEIRGTVTARSLRSRH